MITFTIPGEARGKGRPRAFRRGAHVGMYTDAKTASYENLVKLAASEVMDGSPLECAVNVSIWIKCQIPQSWSKKKSAAALSGDLMPTGKPDLDNVAKAILDAMNGIVFVDDKQVVHLTVSKSYGVEPCAIVKVEPVENNLRQF